MKKKNPKTGRAEKLTERRGWSRQARCEKKSVKTIWAIRSGKAKPDTQ